MNSPYGVLTAVVFILLLLTWYASFSGWGLPSTTQAGVWSVRTGSLGHRSYGGYSSSSYSGGGSHGGK